LARLADGRQPASAYGLQQRNNQATTLFTKDGRISRLTGVWLTNFWVNLCGEIVSDFDEDVINGYKSGLTAASMARWLCSDRAEECAGVGEKFDHTLRASELREL
jgi:hypothetical protein